MAEASRDRLMPRVDAGQILLKNRKDAEKIRGRLAGGTDFGGLAKKHSICNSAKKGGDLGELLPATMAKAFANVVFKKPVLKIHGPIKPRFGYHLIETIYCN